MEKATDNQHFIKAIIDRFEGKMAIIRTEDRQTLHWPIKNLPDDCSEGMAVRLVLSTSQSDTEDREKLAKTILNQLIKRDDNAEPFKQK